MKIGLALLKKYVGQVLTETRSPAGSWLGLRLEKADKGVAELSVAVRPEMCNPYGNIHGGMMALVIDEAIGFAIISLDAEHHYTSVNLNLDFLYAIRQGERLKAIAEVVRMGKKIINVEVKVLHYDNNTLLAKASSNLCVTSMKVLEEDGQIN